MLRATTLAATAVVVVGCGQPPAQRPRVAVLPLRTIGVSAATRKTVRDGLDRAVSQRATLVPRAHVDRAAAAAADCTSEKPDARARCAAEVSARTAARFAVLGAVGRLGDTHLLQLGLFDARAGKLSRSVERTLEGGVTGFARATPALSRELLAPVVAATALRQRHKPWYRRAWIWIVAGAVVAGAAAAVTVPLILRDGSSGDPYENIPLP